MSVMSPSLEMQVGMGLQSNEKAESFAGWPSDSEDSLLIDFSQGLTSSWTGESEFLQMNWSLGTGLLKSQKTNDNLIGDSWGFDTGSTENGTACAERGN